jgi:hypothetical protein
MAVLMRLRAQPMALIVELERWFIQYATVIIPKVSDGRNGPQKRWQLYANSSVFFGSLRLGAIHATI